MLLFKQLNPYFHSLVGLFYPKICASCGEHLNTQENVVCSICTFRLPFTNFHLVAESPLHKKFWGRVDISHIDSLLFLEKASKTQNLLYQLKYQSRQDIGVFLAEQVINRYAGLDIRNKIQLILCVPLHTSKRKKRGYNQCHSFARHLSKTWQIPFSPLSIQRLVNNDSQTGKNRIERWKNVEHSFAIKNKKTLEGKHVLLIDDVLTTGATLEACAIQILAVNQTKLSILTMACKV